MLCASREGRPRVKPLRGRLLGAYPDDRHFVRLGEGVFCCSAALTLAQLAPRLALAELVELCNELVGAFARCPHDPSGGGAAFDLPPYLSREELLWELASLGEGRDVTKALKAASLSCPSAWSPYESVLATCLSLPPGDGGYGLGPLRLNARVHSSCERPMTRGSRVPDIELLNGALGLNYDGENHLDLRLLGRAAMDLGGSPGDSGASRALEQVQRQLREKYVDDRRRDRDLLAAGRGTMVVTKEDLHEPGGLDLLVAQVLVVLEERLSEDFSAWRSGLTEPSLVRLRAGLLRRLLWEHV